MNYHEHSIALTDKAHRRLLQGKTVQIDGYLLTFAGDKRIVVGDDNHAKIEKAKRKGKGARIKLDDHEIFQHGGSLKGFKKFGRQLLGGIKAVNKTGILQPLVQMGAMALGANPLTAGIGSSVTSMALNNGKAVKPAFNANDMMAKMTAGQPVASGQGLRMVSGRGKGLAMCSGRGINKKRIIL